MATLKTKTIQPSTGTNVNLGNAGTAILVNSDSIQTNVYKDSGGNTILQSDGAGTLSNVNTALTGAGPKLILSQTATTGTANISFTANIDSTYDVYMFMFINIHPSTDGARLDFQGSTDGGSTYGVDLSSTAFTAYHHQNGSGGTLTYAASRDQGSGTTFQEICSGIGTDNDQNAAGILYLYSPASTTYMKNWCCRSNVYELGDYTQEYFMSGYFNTTSAINALRFQMHTGNIDDGTIKMYGIS